MKINEVFKTKKVTLSFEIFPPKKDAPNSDQIYKTIDELALLNPDYISVTYGALGTTKEETSKIVSYINQKGIAAVSHLTCISSTKEELLDALNKLKDNNVENIMSLRGDIPLEVRENFNPTILHASELNELIKSNFGDTFCIGGGCYPEVHPECESMLEDIKNLRKKVDSGASFLVSQIVYENQYFYNLVSECRKLGINVPIIAGIMPVTNAKQIYKITKTCNSTIPYSLRVMMERFKDNKEALKEIGIAYASNQIIDLLAHGVDGIHIYVLNKPEIGKAILNSIKFTLEAVNNND